MLKIDEDKSNDIWLKRIIFVGDLHYVNIKKKKNLKKNLRKVSFEDASRLF